jgi:hypothetical protein
LIHLPFRMPRGRDRGGTNLFRHRRSTIEFLEKRQLLAVDTLANHIDAANTGQNLSETVLTPANVSSATFGKRFTATLDGQLYAQILAKANVTITIGAAQGIHNVLFAATMHDSLYAVDADTGTVLWRDSFLQIANPQVIGSPSPTAGVTTVPATTGDNALTSTVIGPELGILSTPVIDAATNTIYVETNTQELRNGSTPVAAFTTGVTDIHFVQRLWAINISSGAVAIVPTNNPPMSLEPACGGQIIGDTILNPTGTNTVPTFTNFTDYVYVAGPYIKGTGDNGDFVPGTGASMPQDGWLVNPADTYSPWGAQGKTPMETGYIAFNALIQMNRVALTEINGTIYIGFASHGDDGPYYGWLLGYNAATLANNAAFVTAPEFEDFTVVSGNGGNNGGFDAQAGLWSSGGSISTDGTYLYFTTGNGAFNPNASNFNSTFTSIDHGNTVQLPLDSDYGDAVLKLAIDPNATQNSIDLNAGILDNPNGAYDPDGGYNANGYGLKVVDYFVPSNELYLNLKDEDMNAGGVLLLPDTLTSNVPGHVGDPMLVAAGKEGRIYLLDRNNLGGFNDNYPSNEDSNHVPLLGPDPSTYDRALGEYYYYEALNPSTTSGNATYRAYSTPSYYNGKFYVGLSGGPELGFGVSTFSTGTSPPGSGVFPTPAFSSATTYGGSGTTATISANGSSNGIIWNLKVSQSSSDQLVAYSASGSGAALFSSATSGSGSLTGGTTNATGVKFTVPTVFNGMVYAGTGGSNKAILGTIVGFGLLTPTLHQPASPTAQATGTNSIHLNWARNAADTESGTRIERSPNGSSGWSVIATVPNTSTSYDDATVAAGTQYFYRMTEVYASSASATSAVVSATTFHYPRGDFDLDHVVTAADIPAMLNALSDLSVFQSSNSLSLGDFQFLADVNRDGIVNNADLQSLISSVANIVGGGTGSIASAPLTTDSAADQSWSGTELHSPTRVDNAMDGVPVSLISSADAGELDSSALSQRTVTFPILNSLAVKRSQQEVLGSRASSVQGTGVTTTVYANAVSANPPYSIDKFRKNRAGGYRSILRIDSTIIDVAAEWTCYCTA